MKLEELQVYQLSMEIGEKVWNIVINWDYFLKPSSRQGMDTIGIKPNNYIKSIEKKHKITIECQRSK